MLVLVLVAVCTQVWNTRGVEGVHRFLARVYRAFEAGVTDEPATREEMRALHTCIKKASVMWFQGVIQVLFARFSGV